MVLDTQAGDTLLRSFQAVKRGGIVVTIGGRPDARFARAWGLSLPLVWILGFLNRKVDRLAKEKCVRFEYLFMHPSGEQLEMVGALVDQGIIKPVVDRTFPFEAAADALSYRNPAAPSEKWSFASRTWWRRSRRSPASTWRPTSADRWLSGSPCCEIWP